jgi:hypothetical protein
LWATATVVCLAGAGASCRGEEERRLLFLQDRPYIVQSTTRVLNQDGREVVQQVFAVAREGSAPIGREMVQRWILGTATLEEARQQANRQLMLLMREVNDAAPLSPEQQRKLELAGRGDIARLLEQCDAVWLEIPGGIVSAQDLDNLDPRCRALRQMFERGLFREESLFQKTLKASVSGDKFERVRKALPAPPFLSAVRADRPQATEN